jgi:hypothetical protein
MKEKPTTFELAQLAAQAAPPNTRPKDAVRRAMALWREAEEEIAEHEDRAEYLRGLFRTEDGEDIPIFTDSPDEWAARGKGYPGDEADVSKAIWDEQFPTVEVEKRLFKDKNVSRDARRRLFLGLVRASIIYGMAGPPIPHTKTIDYLEPGAFIDPIPQFPIHPKNLERAKENHSGLGNMLIPANEVYFVRQVEGVLSKPRIHGHVVRWAVEVRQRQLAAARARLVPQSLRERPEKRDPDENIQFKRPRRQ